jgi:hypothetical protein
VNHRKISRHILKAQRNKEKFEIVDYHQVIGSNLKRKDTLLKKKTLVNHLKVN